MKISVRVRGEWFAVPCKNGPTTVRWIGEEALRRYQKLRPSGTHVSGREERIYQIRKTKGGAILDPDDEIRFVLDDNDFVSVVLETDKESPVTGPAEIHYVPEQVPGKFQIPTEYYVMDGYNLCPEDLLKLGKGMFKIKLSVDSQARITRSRELLETILRENKVAYGVNTGFGKFATTVISDDKIIELQENLIRSHAAGVGQPLTPEKTRMLMALRINVLAKGFSGISLETLNHVIEAFNASCLPWVPEKGTVGASGDLAPLAHLALGMIGEGKMWSPESGWAEAKYVLESHHLKPVQLGAKEGIALLNGTQLITSIGAEALQRAENIAKQSDVVAALSLEVLKGTTRAFDGDIQKVRPHRGQFQVAKRLRSLLHSDTHPSEMAESHRFCKRVQDAYTLRCCPQVHGIVHDTIEFVREVITTEMNSATDNPLVFVERDEIISGGNFHGEYPAKVLDYLAIAVHELGSMSERRTERLINPSLSGLPAFLVIDGGLNSGFMMAHCTAAALVSENKVLCHPASVDSLPTSAGTEDHVSMGGFAARKALTVVENVERVIAIELLAACQAIEFLRPLKTTQPLEAVYSVVRSKVKFVLINCYPLYSSVYSKLNVGLMIAFCWTFSYAILVPTLVGRWGRFGYEEASFSCTILRGPDGRSPKKFLFVLAFLMPTVTIILCYSCIFYKVRRSAVKVLSHADATSKRTSRVLPRKRDDLRVTCTMLTCFCTFQICFLPLMVVNVFEENIRYPILHILASVLAWMSACTNPFIYVLLNKHYREAYFQLLCSWRLMSGHRRGPASEGGSGNSRTSHLRTICGEQSRDSQLSVSRDVYV